LSQAEPFDVPGRLSIDSGLGFEADLELTPAVRPNWFGSRFSSMIMCSPLNQIIIAKWFANEDERTRM